MLRKCRPLWPHAVRNARGISRCLPCIFRQLVTRWVALSFGMKDSSQKQNSEWWSAWVSTIGLIWFVLLRFFRVEIFWSLYDRSFFISTALSGSYSVNGRKAQSVAIVSNSVLGELCNAFHSTRMSRISSILIDYLRNKMSLTSIDSGRNHQGRPDPIQFRSSVRDLAITIFAER